MTDRIRKAFGDLKARQDVGEHMSCPRCGRDNMKENIHTNALSRFANVYICNQCGMAEALLSYTGAPPRLRNWAIIEAIKELFSEE